MQLIYILNNYKNVHLISTTQLYIITQIKIWPTISFKLAH